MPEISRFYGIVIKMYYKDHNPPHFHAIYQGFMAEYDINTLELIAGKIPVRAHSMVLEWASLHRKELLNNWSNCKKHAKLNKIKPLD